MAGFTGVWATDNTREAIFDAMQRKEAYSTSGSRMLVRFFGGFDFVPADAQSRTPGKPATRRACRWAAICTPRRRANPRPSWSPRLKDPLGGNLDRIQIIKGWVEEDGRTQEKIFDVVWGDADRRQAGADGKLPPVGNTVDVANAVWTNTIGDPELITVWTDPEFDPALSAFYYARVIEIPTPRWTAYDAKRFGVKMDDNVPMITQERAFTSPIWYTPAG